MSGIRASSDPKVKGVTLRSAMQALERLRGKAMCEAAMQLMPRELAEGLRYGTIVAARWYPIRWYRELHSAIVAATNEGDGIIRAVEREAARADMTGVYKLAFDLLSPQILISVSSRLFSRYYDTGRVEMLEPRAGFVRVRYSGCRGFNRSIWAGIFASNEMLLELAGAKNVRIRLRSGGGADDDFAEIEAYWT